MLEKSINGLTIKYDYAYKQKLVDGEYVDDTTQKIVKINDVQTNETNVVFPDCIDGYPITIFEKHVLENNQIIETVILPEYLEELRDYDFANCQNLKSIKFPESLKFVGYQVFRNCTALLSIDLSSQELNLGGLAFADCTSLNNINLSDDIFMVNTKALHNTAYFNDEKNWTDGVLYIGNHLIYSRNTTPVYKVRDGTVSIASYAFENNFTVSRVIVPKTLKTIGYRAFCDKFVSFGGERCPAFNEEIEYDIF